VGVQEYVNSYGDMDVVEQHRDWFVRDAKGKAYVGPWIGYAIDASSADALKAQVRPTYRGFKDAGFSYVKIDTLRHYLYDNLQHNLDYCRQRGFTLADVFRKYLGVALQELGQDTFVLSCWGVLPESVGIADACRTTLRFADLDLDSGKTYLVYEFWSHQFLGSCRGQVEVPAIKGIGLASFAIREQLAHPQIVSTSRHLSQGSVDLVSPEWKGYALSGRSRVVAGDRYEIAIRMPAGFSLKSAGVAGQPVHALTEGELVRLAWNPSFTAEVEWKLVTSTEAL
jgi:hypothetical protein